MKAIILAAGKGMRLNNDERSAIPKSMENINGISIMHYQLNNCLKNGIKKFVIVVGYKKELLIEHVLEVLKEEQVYFVENPIYDKTNTLHSLYLTLRFMCEDFIYFNADVLFHPFILRKLVNGEDSSLLMIEKKPVGDEEVKVIIENDIIKEIHKQVDIKKAVGEFIGIAKFVKQDLPSFKDCLEFGVYNNQSNNYFEYAVNMMAQDRQLKAIYTDGLPCIEIDYPEDLKKAKEELFKDIVDFL
ncbi:MAG: phosphocholine cytidylyltransferase family protein [Candidatus Cloacimonetes bacterium]|jgi:choline kinase|nr:phosphocholine cytidylyltransferase family protein [Candidatus Cloacimonadota bacterium]